VAVGADSPASLSDLQFTNMFAIDEATIESIHRALTKAASCPPSSSCAGNSR
jgi:hypothetical protein